MVRLKVVSPTAKFTTGLIGLTPEQATGRLESLKPVGAGPGFTVYEILAPMQFQRGDVVRYEGDKAPRTGVEVLE